jgi:AAA domain/Relaxase/Mobilisation nuclease domain
MIVKVASNPKKGGSAKSLARYLLNYALSPKATAAQKRDAYDNLMAQALAREDAGVGAIWKPEGGDPKRPSYVFARNVASFNTFDIETDSLAKANGQVKESVTQMIFSLNTIESRTMKGDELIAAVLEVLDRLGLEDHGALLTVHEDTDNLHCHVALANVSPADLRSYDHYQFYSRAARETRFTEIARGMDHDRGLWVVREHDGAKTVEKATKEEFLTWRRENAEHRADSAVVRSQDDYSTHESPETWVRDVLSVRLGDTMRAAQDRGEPIYQADLHRVAHESNARLRRDDAGRIEVAIWQRIPEDEQPKIVVDLPDSLGDSPTRLVRTRDTGIRVILDPRDAAGWSTTEATDQPKYRDMVERPRTERLDALSKNFLDVAAAEEQLIQAIEYDPDLVVRSCEEDEAAFTRSAIDRYLAKRITDPGGYEIARLSEQIENESKLLKIISADTRNPLYTTTHIEQIEKEVHAMALELAGMKDASFNHKAMEDAIARVEKEKKITLTREQRDVVYASEYRLSAINGDAGTGKTSGCMRVLSEYAKITNTSIVGICTSQNATLQLGKDAKFGSVNSAYMLHREGKGEAIVPEKGLLCIDEASMIDLKPMHAMLKLALERGCKAQIYGDLAQMQSIGAGDVFAVTSDACKQRGTYAEITQVVRQEAEWHRKTVAKLGRAIREEDVEAVSECINVYAKNGIIRICEPDRDATLNQAASWYLEAVEKYGYEETILTIPDKMTCRHADKLIQGMRGLSGTGQEFRTDHGVVELAIGDRIAFLKNDDNVVNGQNGTVTKLWFDKEQKRTLVEVQRDAGDLVTFSPNHYRSWKLGYAQTLFKSQSASVKASCAVGDKGYDLRKLQVATTRGQVENLFLMPASICEDAASVATFLCEKFETKPDAILFQALVNKWGGPETVIAKRVKAAAKNMADPLHREHATEMKARAAKYLEDMKSINAAFRIRAKQATTAEEKRFNRGAHAAAAARAKKKYAPQSFVAWCASNEQKISFEAQRMEGYRRVCDLRHSRVSPERAPSQNSWGDEEAFARGAASGRDIEEAVVQRPSTRAERIAADAALTAERSEARRKLRETDQPISF